MEFTTLEIKDEALYRMFVDQYRANDNCNFEDSWAYILQATRNSPRKYADEDTLVLLTERQRTEKQSSILVVPNFFAPADNKLVDIIRGLHRTVILKNVDVRDIERFRELGFDKYKEGEEWDKNAPYDDQTFPQYAVKLEEILQKKGKDYAVLRRDLNRFEDRNKENKEIRARQYHPETDKNKLVELIMELDKRNPGTFDSHRIFFDLCQNQYILPLIFEIEGKIVGYSLIDRISENCAAFNAMIYNIKIPFLSTKLTFESIKIAYQKGYEYMNMQGSETAGVDRWKRKFNLKKSIRKTHLIYRQ